MATKKPLSAGLLSLWYHPLSCSIIRYGVLPKCRVIFIAENVVSGHWDPV